MSEILEEMFSGLVIYVWNNPLDDDDFGAIVLRAQDCSKALEHSEYLPDDQHATSFYEFTCMLRSADISFFDISDKTDMYVYTE